MSARLASELGYLQPDGFPGLPDSWEADAGEFQASDGMKISELRLRDPKSESEDALFIVHGQGEHIGRYWHAPHYLQGAVSEIGGADLRGHGKSGGKRAHINRFDEYVHDTHLALDRFSQGKKRVHLLGHSMGGLIALRLLLLYPNTEVASITISSPLLGIRVKVPKIKEVVGKWLSDLLPSFQMGSGLDIAFVSHDVAVQTAYKRDKLNHSLATPRFFTELLWAMDDTLQKTRSFRVPIQFLLSLEDRIVDPEKAVELVGKVAAPKLQLRKYEGFYHEPFNEGGAGAPPGITKERAFQDLKSWIQGSA